jgi:hypothetical protein
MLDALRFYADSAWVENWDKIIVPSDELIWDKGKKAREILAKVNSYE